jgi:hypothetical protein
MTYENMQPFNPDTVKVLASPTFKQDIRTQWKLTPERKYPDTRELILKYSTLVSVPKNTRLSDLDCKCLFILYSGTVCSLPKNIVTHDELHKDDVHKVKSAHAD